MGKLLLEQSDMRQLSIKLLRHRYCANKSQSTARAACINKPAEPIDLGREVEPSVRKSLRSRGIALREADRDRHSNELRVREQELFQ